MEKSASFKAIVAIGGNLSLVVYAPQEALDCMDGRCGEDNGYRNLPTLDGIYLCTVDFYFEQGYCDGYKAGGESDWEFKVVKSEPILCWPSVTNSWEISNDDKDS